VLTRKHFEAIAAILKAEKDTFQGNEAAELAVERVAYNLADAFTEFSSRFDPVRFLTASGVDEPSALPVVHEVKEPPEDNSMLLSELHEMIRDVCPDASFTENSKNEVMVYTGYMFDPSQYQELLILPYDKALMLQRVIPIPK
jgi:hypothetical protein